MAHPRVLLTLRVDYFRLHCCTQLSHFSPKECRGAIGMITGTCVQFGTVIGSIIAMPQIFGTYDLWYVNSLMTDVR